MMKSVSLCTIMLCFITLVSPSFTWCANQSDYEYILDPADSELVMAFMIFRHGDRAPIDKTMQYITDKVKVLNLLQRTGYGQLTNSGLRRVYRTGAFIRRRYGSLLSPQYNQSEIYIRTTDSTRTQMSVLIAMSAVYPPKETWCEDEEWCLDNNWSPVPYSMDNAIYDYNMGFFNCPLYVTQYNTELKGPCPGMSKYSKFLDEWSQMVPYNVTEAPCKAYLIHDAYNSQISMGVPLSPSLENIIPLMENAAGAAFRIVFQNKSNMHLGAGVLLKEFFNTAEKVTSGEEVPKVYVYSAHDVNVGAFMAVTQARPRVTAAPKYGALYSLELRRVKATGQYIVVPVYLKTPEDEDAVTLIVEGCEVSCELSKFRELVSKYELEVNEWRKQCGWSADYDFDYSLIN